MDCSILGSSSALHYLLEFAQIYVPELVMLSDHLILCHLLAQIGSLPCGSDGNVSACNAGDLGLIPRSGRSPGEGNGNPFQYSCLKNSMDCLLRSLVADSSWAHKESDTTEKCLPVMQETWVWSLYWEDPLKKEMATHSNILAWRIPWTEEPDRVSMSETWPERLTHTSFCH